MPHDAEPKTSQSVVRVGRRRCGEFDETTSLAPRPSTVAGGQPGFGSSDCQLRFAEGPSTHCIATALTATLQQRSEASSWRDFESPPLIGNSSDDERVSGTVALAPDRSRPPGSGPSQLCNNHHKPKWRICCKEGDKQMGPTCGAASLPLPYLSTNRLVPWAGDH